MNQFLFVGILLIGAIYAGRAFHKIKLPVVTGYILIGFLLGNVPYFSNHLSPYLSQITNYVDEIALAVISFEMGMEFSLKALKKIENKIIVITFIQAIFTYVIILFTFRFLLQKPLGFSMIIASIGIATAPSIIILVLREIRTRNKLTEYLKGIVTLDDLITEFIFIITIPFVKGALVSHVSITTSLFSVLEEISISVVIGFAAGTIFTLMVNEFKKLRSLFAVTISLILILIGISIWLNLHIIFVFLLIGIIFTNLTNQHNTVANVLSQIDAPLFIVFLIVNGSALSSHLLVSSGIMGAAFILSRGIGKIVGTYIGGITIKEPLYKKIGLALLPQSEISIYLSVIAKNAIPVYGNTIFAVAMSGVIVFEIIGAPLLKYTLNSKNRAKKVVFTKNAN